MYRIYGIVKQRNWKPQGQTRYILSFFDFRKFMGGLVSFVVIREVPLTGIKKQLNKS